MDFFKRFQKPILIGTSAIVISSFAFYGVFSVIQPSSSASVKEKVFAFKTIKGRKVYDRDVELFEKMLTVALISRNSPLLDEESTFVKRWFEDRIAIDVLKPFSSEFLPIVKEKIEYLKNDKGYIHPKAPYISEYRVLSDLSREFGELHQKIRGSEEITPEVVGDFLELFVVGSDFSSDLIRTFLLYQQKQLPPNQHDPSLPYRNFVHFGWKKPSDWLGVSGVFLLARSFEHLYDLSISCKYKPTIADVQKKFFQADMHTPQELMQAERVFLEQLHKEGIEESEFWIFWQKWFVIENWMSILSREAVFDMTHLSQTYADYLTDIDADVYELPSELNFKDVFQMLEFQVYLDTISIQNSGISKSYNLELPQEFCSPEELKKRVPELVQTTTPIVMQKIGKQTVDSQVSLRAVWALQKSDQGWQTLLAQFPFLKEQVAGIDSVLVDRLQAIKSLPQDLKKAVDEFSLGLASAQFLAENPQDQAPLLKENLHCDAGGNCYLGKILLQDEKLKPFLDAGEVGSELIIATKSHFYRFKITEPQKSTILTYADASRRGMTKNLLDKRLEKTYLALTKSGSQVIQGEEGNIQALQDCRLKVAEAAFEPLFKSLKTVARTYDPSASESTLFAFRFCNYFELVKKELGSQGSTSRKIKQSSQIEDIADLAEQWYLVASHKKIPLLEIQEPESLPKGIDIIAWKDKFVLLRVNFTEENQERKESKVLELKKTLERTYLREKIQEKISSIKKSGDLDV